MDFRHFRIFLAVCEAGSMTRAAAGLYMTQPSVSQAVAELEREYGARLFERLNHRLYLTAAGEQLRSYASHILNLAGQARKDLAGLGGAGSLRVGASLTVGAHLLPGLVNAFQAEMPLVEIFTQVDNTIAIEQLILEDQLDLGVVEGQVYSPHVREEALCDDELAVICGPGSAFWDRARLGVADLVGSAFIIREPGSGTRDLFERAMSAAGIGWKIAGVYNNTEAIKQAVRGNLGLAVAPRISVEEEVQRGQLRVLEIEELNLARKFRLVIHHQKFLTPAIETFIRLSRQVAHRP